MTISFRLKSMTTGAKIKNMSPIQEYFKGSCVMITGVTGFLGMLLLEKLLRTCSGIKKVFVLVRTKHGVSIDKRFEDVLDNAIFDRIKKEQPQFWTKIILIEGDCALPNMGLDKNTQNQLLTEVNHVFHCAATVRFNEKLRSAVDINIRAVKTLLHMAKQMIHLKSLVHFSTAYSNCTRYEIDEVIYKPELSGKELLAIVDAINEELLDRCTPKYVPNNARPVPY